MEVIIFYSWQSDRNNNTNRGFILDCLEKAIRDVTTHNNLGLDYNLDRDTQGIPGTPDIVGSIFKKIENCGIFVADITLINSDCPARKTPNPNVLIELGYAAAILGWHRIVCVYNSAYGAVEELPFDLQHRRPLLYNLGEQAQNKLEVRQQLTNAFVRAIQAIEDSGLPRLRGEVREFLARVNPSILPLLEQGRHSIAINLNPYNQNRLFELQRDPLFERIVIVVANGSFLGNNTNRIGNSINDLGNGALSGFDFNFQSAFFED